MQWSHFFFLLRKELSVYRSLILMSFRPISWYWGMPILVFYFLFYFLSYLFFFSFLRQVLMHLKMAYVATISIELLPLPPKYWDYKWTPLCLAQFFLFFFGKIQEMNFQRILMKLTDSGILFSLVACRTAISLKDANFGLKDKGHCSDLVVGWEPACALHYQG